MIDDVRQIVREAGKLTLKFFNRLKHSEIKTKEMGGLQTLADTETEDFLIQELQKLKPGSAVLAEESGKREGDQGRWIIDPIDGTSNFANGLPWYCISVAFEEMAENNPLSLGVIYNPVFNEMFHAVKGGGAFVNDQTIHVSDQKDFSHAMIATGFYYHKGPKLHAAMEIFERMQQRALGVRRFGSAALDLAYLAAGHYDAFWEEGLSPWDLAAGILIIEEAGGKITDFEGKPFSLFGSQTAASNVVLHSELLGLIRSS